MRQSILFGKTLRHVPKDEISTNAQLLMRGGFIEKVMAGVYAFLPLGLRALENINRIIREEMNAIGGQELLLSALQPKDLWQKTGRWETLKDVMYQFQDSSQRELGLGVTHEEPLAEVAKNSIRSYKDLPLAVYQIQLKFRNEPRAKSGLIRVREFFMKDLYSFDRDQAGLDAYYERCKEAYKKVFSRCGLDARVVEASGGAFTKDFTHEFQVLAEAGEDTIVYCESCAFAQNKEIATAKAEEPCPNCSAKLKEGTSVEVGHIYKLGTKYSKDLGLMFTDEDGLMKPVVMGSYGIGPGRVMATIVEVHHDEKGIVWPKEVAPYGVHLLEIKNQKSKIKNDEVTTATEKLYRELQDVGIAVLYDDRDESAGVKFADADLIGLPWRIVASEKTLEKHSVEIKARSSNESQLMPLDKTVEKIKAL
ncbi:hypothetical protein HYW67_04075 [Candidatus Parcubacteria bacterium]|nr:hypothetical protein [Candidatus Parcubacteria bacterium]